MAANRDKIRRDALRKQQAQGGANRPTQSAQDASGTGAQQVRESRGQTPQQLGAGITDGVSARVASEVNSFDRTNTDPRTGRPRVGFLTPQTETGRSDTALEVDEAVTNFGRNIPGFLSSELDKTKERVGSAARFAGRQATQGPLGATVRAGLAVSSALDRIPEEQDTTQATINSTVPSETLNRELEGVPDTPQSRELGVLNDPTTIRDTIGTDDLRTIDPNDRTGTRELPLQATSSRIPGQLGASFQFDDVEGFGSGTVSTTNPERAARLAQGSAIRGVQAPSINVDNLVQANRAENIQRAIAEGTRLGRSPGDILSIVNELEGNIAPRDRLTEQLDRVDELERTGQIGGVVAQNRRNRLNAAITDRQTADTRQQALSQGSTEFGRQQANREAGTSISLFNAQTNRAKVEADDLARSGKTLFEQTKTITNLLNDENNPLPLGVAVNQFGLRALNASSKALQLRTKINNELRDNPDPQDQQDILQEGLEDLGLPDLNQDLFRSFLQGKTK